jgi:hypothetical protein
MPHREGFACAGNWIIDHVRLIDHYPGEEGLAFIREESKSTGGCAYNVICDLRAIDPDLPLYAIGVIGAVTIHASTECACILNAHSLF